MMDEQAIEALLEESRVFPPAPEFARQAIVNSPEVYERVLHAESHVVRRRIRVDRIFV